MEFTQEQIKKGFAETMDKASNDAFKMVYIIKENIKAGLYTFENFLEAFNSEDDIIKELLYIGDAIGWIETFHFDGKEGYHVDLIQLTHNFNYYLNLMYGKDVTPIGTDDYISCSYALLNNMLFYNIAELKNCVKEYYKRLQDIKKGCKND